MVPAPHLAGRRPRFFYLVSLPLWLATLVRAFDEGDRDRLPLTVVLLVVYLALFLSEHRLAQRIDWYATLYVGLQLAVVFVMMTLQPDIDFFAVLLIPVSAQIALLPSTWQRRWWFVATIAVMASGLLLYQDFPRSLALILLFGAAYQLIASYASVTEQAEWAEAQSRELVVELQEANQQLIENTATIEALAVVQERNRLARELHDSVSQSLYGLALSAEAARRNLASGHIADSADELESMSATAREALAEMRLLIYELRPSEIENNGLQRALETRLETVERRAGLHIHLDYEVEGDLPLRTEMELERVASEALTNAVRHAHATSIEVAVRTDRKHVVLEVRDDGIGFDPAARAGGFGLRGMKERAERLGGTLAIDSQAGAGTRVRLEAPV
jgi:signal transduction histidine kinase